MQQEFLILADGAEAVNGKIFILGGGVERHTAPAFEPFAVLNADIACSVLVAWGEANRTFAVTLKIVDEDEKAAVALEFTMETGRPPGAKPGQDLRTLMAVRGPFPIPHPGGFKLAMELNGVAQAPPFRFWVDHVPVAAAAP
ncbi:MAG: hypothetical protein IVW53_04590 [Chloroflexi bacterium]|nr:hypothetical protein [Chloroflexota bacterium]